MNHGAGEIGAGGTIRIAFVDTADADGTLGTKADLASICHAAIAIEFGNRYFLAELFFEVLLVFFEDFQIIVLSGDIGFAFMAIDATRRKSAHKIVL